MLNENQDITAMERLERIVKKLREYPGVTGPPVSAPSRMGIVGITQE
jgi:hypothetical protein